MGEKNFSITLPQKLFEKIESRAKASGFSSVSAYAAFMLEEVLAGLESNVSKSDEKEMRKNLKNLGYTG